MSSFLSISASAEGVTYSVTNVSGQKGETVTVCVDLSSGVELWGGIVSLVYNSSELQFVSCSKGDITSSGSLNHSGSSVIYAGQYSGKSGTVMIVVFKILKDSGTSNLTLTSSENIDSDGKEYSSSVRNGVVKIIESGDVDGNCSVTAIDARLALRHTVDESTLSESQQNVADMNEDGKVTAIDAHLILKKAVE